jgi:glyoxylase-like metal-dependent hydrolase (beta-lactamase superfamily II)
MERMLSWQVGRVRITRIVEMDLPVPAAMFLPQATPEELRKLQWLYPHFVSQDDSILKLSVHALLVDAPGMKLVVDTCVGNDRPGDMTGGEPLATPFLQHLADAGFPRQAVDTVVCTHLHEDHVGWNTMLDNGKWVPTFPSARYLIVRREYEYWSTHKDPDQKAMLGNTVQPVVDAGLVQLVELDHILSPEVRLMPSVGHTPGHVSVMIESDGQRAVITGDIAHHPVEIAHPGWQIGGPGEFDPEAAAHTRSRLFTEWADQPILVIGTHFPAPTAGHIVRDGAAFKFAVSAVSLPAKPAKI